MNINALLVCFFLRVGAEQNIMGKKNGPLYTMQYVYINERQKKAFVALVFELFGRDFLV